MENTGNNLNVQNQGTGKLSDPGRWAVVWHSLRKADWEAIYLLSPGVTLTRGCRNAPVWRIPEMECGRGNPRTMASSAFETVLLWSEVNSPGLCPCPGPRAQVLAAPALRRGAQLATRVKLTVRLRWVMVNTRRPGGAVVHSW